MSRSRVTVTCDTRGFARYGDKVEADIMAAIKETTEIMAQKAQELEKYGTGTLRSSIQPLEVVKTKRGFMGGIGSADWRANWAEKGTRNRRTGKGGKAAKARAAASGSFNGEKALHFLSKALYSGFPLLVERVRRAMRP